MKPKAVTVPDKLHIMFPMVSEAYDVSWQSFCNTGSYPNIGICYRKLLLTHTVGYTIYMYHEPE